MPTLLLNQVELGVGRTFTVWVMASEQPSGVVTVKVTGMFPVELKAYMGLATVSVA